MNSSRQKRSATTGQNVKMTNLNGIRSNESEENFKNMSTEEALLSSNKKSKKKMRNQNKPECIGTNDCSHCLDEREINLVYLEENQLLWSELRGHVLYMYKIGRDQNLGPTIVDRVRFLVDTLCSKDIHQLFIRLELLATEVVKDCLESVERIFLNEIRNTTIAFNYLENIIADCDNYLFAARKMLPMLKNLEIHLKKFNVCWILLHQNLFRIHYLEDRRCQIRAKKAKILLLSDYEIPAFTETILKFSQFNGAFGALSTQWDESVAKIKKFRESKQIYKNCQHLLNDTWQNFNMNKKANKFIQENRNSQEQNGNNKKTNFDLKINNKNIQLNQNTNNFYDNNSALTKTQAKKARRKMKGDHSRQPSADLMPPPPPPRISESDLINCASSQTIHSEHEETGEHVHTPMGNCQREVRDKPKKKVLPPPPASPTPPTSPLKKFGPSMSVDNRDVDALVAFVEGLNINEKNIDIIECENKRRRKKQKKEKQRLKKMQNLLEEDQVAQLIKRSPGVTITMVRSNGNNSPNNITNNNNSRNIPQTKQQHSPLQQQQQQQQKQPPPRNIPNPPKPSSHPNNNNNNNETVSKETVIKNGGSIVVENSGSRMVTIRRITEANTDEPTVTITLKGPTPDQDQVLYRIINGQANYGHLADNVLNKKNSVTSTNNNNNNNNNNTVNKDHHVDKHETTTTTPTPLVQLTKKQMKKLKRNELSIESVPAPPHHINQSYLNYYEPLMTQPDTTDDDVVHVTKCSSDYNKCSKKSKKSSADNCGTNVNHQTKVNNTPAVTKNKKKVEEKKVVETPCDTNSKVIKNSKQNTKQKSQQKVIESLPIASTTKLQSSKIVKPDVTKSSASIKSQQSFETSKKVVKPLTNTKVPKLTVAQRIVNSVTNLQNRQRFDTDTRPRPIIKPVEVPKQQSTQSIPVTKRLPSQPPICRPQQQTANSNQSREVKTDNRHVSHVYYVKPNEEKPEPYFNHHQNPPSVFHQKSTPQSMNNGSDIFHDANANNYKLIPENLRLPAGITITKVPPNCNTRKMPYDNTQRKFNMNNLDITPESSRVHFGNEPIRPRNDLSVDLIIEKQQQLESDFEIRPENRQPPIGTGVPRACDAPAKFIRAPDGRIIIRSPMARSTTPPLNPITMIRQDLEMGVPPPNVPIPPFWSRNDWWLPGADNVFAPKDIDLEDNSLDAEERELEAFKRFCQEPVPPQRQEVTHLNVQKIIIKKNHPS